MKLLITDILGVALNMNVTEGFSNNSVERLTQNLSNI